ncbi:MAG: hypothetical protein Cons2KO_09810 [Congregibacter sp.]
MENMNKNQEQRRKVLTLLGSSAVAIPVLGLSACGGGDDSASAPAKLAADAGDAMQKKADDMAKKAEAAAESMSEKAEETMEAAQDTMEEAAEEATDDAESAMEEAKTIATDAGAGMAKVDENGAQASGLGYKHDASTIDASSQPRYAAGQQCSNCVLYQGGDAEWGGCPLFAGQQVKATGWCSAYSARG